MIPIIAVNEIRDWINAEARLKDVKATEMRLRKKICDHVLQNTDKGTVSLEIFGWKLSATAKINVSLDSERLQAIIPDLSPSELEAINWKPSLIVKAYKLLPEATKLNEAVTEKAGTPSLKIKVLEKK